LAQNNPHNSVISQLRYLKLGKIRANLRYHSAVKVAEAGKSTCIDMLTCTLVKRLGLLSKLHQIFHVGIFTLHQACDADNLLAGPECLASGLTTVVLLLNLQLSKS
jgi:hypothetical protein